MKNAEKYAEQIASLIALNVNGVCCQFAKEHNGMGGYDCDTCALCGMCNNEEEIKEWLLEEADE